MTRRLSRETCELCERCFLPGEPQHGFEQPERGRRVRVVCGLCQRRALLRGWVRTTDQRERDGQAA